MTYNFDHDDSWFCVRDDDGVAILIHQTVPNAESRARKLCDELNADEISRKVWGIDPDAAEEEGRAEYEKLPNEVKHQLRKIYDAGGPLDLISMIRAIRSASSRDGFIVMSLEESKKIAKYASNLYSLNAAEESCIDCGEITGKNKACRACALSNAAEEESK